MRNIGVYILLVVIGVAVGASALYFLMPNQIPTVTEPEVKVTIQGIKIVESEYPVFELELLNDAPERNLEGIIGIHQGSKQWTSEVTWHYSGYGEATVLCDTINSNESFRVTYNEKNPEATYLDRTIEWWEIEFPEHTIGFIQTKELTITQMTFDIANDNITISLTNSGTSEVIVSLIKVNGATESAFSGTTAYDADETGTIDVSITSVVAGNKYAVNLFTADGTMVGSYTDTA